MTIPLACKGGLPMRTVLSLAFLASTLAAYGSTNLRIVGPDSRPVSGARVILSSSDGKVISQSVTDAEGKVIVSSEQPDNRIKILAPGFSSADMLFSIAGETILLKVAAPSETVEVTAAATPVSSEQSGSIVETFDA